MPWSASHFNFSEVFRAREDLVTKIPLPIRTTKTADPTTMPAMAPGVSTEFELDVAEEDDEEACSEVPEEEELLELVLGGAATPDGSWHWTPVHSWSHSQVCAEVNLPPLKHTAPVQNASDVKGGRHWHCVAFAGLTWPPLAQTAMLQSAPVKCDPVQLHATWPLVRMALPCRHMLQACASCPAQSRPLQDRRSLLSSVVPAQLHS